MALTFAGTGESYGPFVNRIRSYWNPSYPAYWSNQPPSAVTITTDDPASIDQTKTTTIQIPQLTATTTTKPTILGPRESYIAYMGLACIVFWCCGSVLFGLAAFILAAIANSEYVTLPQAARRLGRMSLFLSIAGVVVSMVIAAIVLSIYFGVCKYQVNGTCYTYQRSVGTQCCATGQSYINGYCFSRLTNACTYYYNSNLCFDTLSNNGGCCNSNEVFYSSYCYS